MRKTEKGRKLTIAWLGAVLAVAAFGCGGGSDSAGLGNGSNGMKTYTCNFASHGFCYEFAAPSSITSAQESQLQNACTSGGGSGFSSGTTCPSAGRVGTCAYANSSVAGVPWKWMFYAPNTAASGQSTCASSGGTWTAG
jgi:hypothetical protein